MPLPDYYIKQGDHGLVIRTVCEDSTGAAINIGNTATVRFLMKPIDGGTIKVAAAATNENASSPGQVSYAFQAADADTDGLFLAEFEVTYAGGVVQTFPNGGYILVRVTKQLA